MSRHVRNLLRLKGDDKHLFKFKLENCNSNLKLLSFNELIFIPSRYFYNVKLYTKRLNKWGTILDAYQVTILHINKELIYSFCTAYNPPVEWLREAAKEYPSIGFNLCFKKDEKVYSISYTTI